MLKGCCWEKKELKINTLEDIMLINDNLEATGWRMFVMRKRANQKKWTRMLFLWFVLILTINEKWLSEYNRNFDYCIHVSIPIPLLWTSLQLEHMPTIETNTEWKSLHFHGPEKPLNWLNWLKIKITKIEENLNKTVKHCQK